MKKDYNHMILERIEESFDKVMPIGSFVAFASAIALYFSSISRFFLLLNLIIGIMMLIVTIFKNRLETETKIIITICIPYIIGVFSFIDGGFQSAGITLFIISNMVAVLFLEKRKSRFVAISTAVLFVMLYLIAFMIPNGTDPIDGVTYWLIHFFVMILLLVIIHLIVYTMRDYLLENIVDLEDSIDKIYELAYFDQLTGLMNEYQFSLELKKILADDGLGFLIIFNIRNLGIINSIYNDKVGDDVLVEFSQVLLEHSSSMTISRMGGGEFGVWLYQEDERKIDKWIHDVINRFQLKYNDNLLNKRVEFNAVYTKHVKGESVSDLIHNAKLALIYAKSHEDLAVVPYDEVLEKKIKKNEHLKERIEYAIENKDFYCMYQCKVDANTKDIVSVEALARWRDDVLGGVSPGVFVPMIEKMGYAKIFGDLIIDIVFGHYSKLVEKYGDNLTVSINISPSHLVSEGFVRKIRSDIEKYSIPPNSIIIEITEEVLIHNMGIVHRVLEELKALDFSISLDDFGSGYSSLKYLAQLNLDELKIDKLFINQILKDDKVRKLVEMIIELSKYYNLRVVAEGVESQSQSDLLHELGVHELQGYFYSYPSEI